MKTTRTTKLAIAALVLVTVVGAIQESHAQNLVIGGRRFTIQLGRPAPVIVQQPGLFMPQYSWNTPRYGFNQNWYGNQVPGNLCDNPFVNQRPRPVRPIVYRPVNINGTWRSRYGRVLLVQTGNRFQGTIFKRNGRRTTIRGRIVGRTIRFKWHSSAVSFGRGRLTVNNRRNMSGTLTNIRTGVTGTFNLVR